MARILRRYNITVPREIKKSPYEKYWTIARRPVPPRIEERKSYFIDDLLKAINCKKGNGH